MTRVLLFLLGLAGLVFRLRAGIDGSGAIIGTVLHLFALVALAGWMLRKPFYRQGFWRVCFLVHSFFIVVAALLLSAVLFMAHDGAVPPAGALNVLLLTALFQLPLIAGLYLYAYRSRSIWARTSNA